MRSLKIVILGLILILVSGCSNSRVITPSSTQGTILDDTTNEVIPNALVLKLFFDYRTTSNKKGHFLIPEIKAHSITMPPMSTDITPLSYDFIIAKDGYEPKICNTAYTIKGSKNINIKLKKDKSFQNLDYEKLMKIHYQYRSRALWTNDDYNRIGEIYNDRSSAVLRDDNYDRPGEGVECLKSLKSIRGIKKD